MNIKYLIFLFVFVSFGCERSDHDQEDLIKISDASIDNINLSSNELITSGQNTIALLFNIEVQYLKEDFKLKNITTNQELDFDIVKDGDFTLVISNKIFFDGNSYELTISNKLNGPEGFTFGGKSYTFEVVNNPLSVVSVTFQDKSLSSTEINNIDSVDPIFALTLSEGINLQNLENHFIIIENQSGEEVELKIVVSGSAEYMIFTKSSLKPQVEYKLKLEETTGSSVGKKFDPMSYRFIIGNAELSDDELLSLVQSQTLKYFWDFGHPVSGLARERNSSIDLVTTGGSGFGLMAMIVGVEREFISREDAIGRWEIMLSFLKNADRFHGAWSHWMNGASGKALPFSAKDNGADLVETAFMVQALITLRQYLNPNDAREASLIDRINFLWDAVEWDWFTRGGQKTLYWHWSPDFDWDMNFRISGHNETLITYVLAASSTTHTIDKDVYNTGYARNGGMKNGNTYYGFNLPLGAGRGGPLFFSHYSFIGLDPRNLSDEYANYWQQNTNHTQVNRSYCYANPLNKKGYGKGSWGLTACDGNNGYSAFSPDNDKGVIAPTAALSSMPYTPVESMEVIKRLYYDLGDKMWGPYGFYDSYNESADWYATSNLAIDQGPIVCMIENHRTGLLWDLFMSAPEIQGGLTKLGFTY